MRCLITGGAGHIGSALIRAVEWDVTVVDDFRTGRCCSLFSLPRPVRLIEQDFMEADLPSLVAGQDACVHLAALTDAAGSIGRTEAYHYVNAQGVNVLAEACRDAGVPLVFLSTTSVYGPQTGTVDETLPRHEYRPASPYAESKRAAELLLEEFWGPRGLKYVTLRCGTIYGTSPGMRFHTAVNKFCWQAAHGQPITVWKDAWDTKRPYLSLLRTIAAIRWAAHGLTLGGIESGMTRNILSENCSVRDVLRIIAGMFEGRRVTVHEVDTPILNQQSYEVHSVHSLDLPDRLLSLSIADTFRLLRPDLFASLPERAPASVA